MTNDSNRERNHKLFCEYIILSKLNNKFHHNIYTQQYSIKKM